MINRENVMLFLIITGEYFSAPKIGVQMHYISFVLSCKLSHLYSTSVPWTTINLMYSCLTPITLNGNF